MIKAACTRPRCTMPIAYLQCDFIVKDLRTTGECQILLIHNTVDGLLTITSRLLNFEERQRRSTEVRMRDINNAIHGDIDKMLTITTCMFFQYKLCVMLQFYNSHCQAKRLMDIVRKVSVRAEVVCVFMSSGSGARRWTQTEQYVVLYSGLEYHTLQSDIGLPTKHTPAQSTPPSLAALQTMMRAHIRNKSTYLAEWCTEPGQNGKALKRVIKKNAQNIIGSHPLSISHINKVRCQHEA